MQPKQHVERLPLTFQGELRVGWVLRLKAPAAPAVAERLPVNLALVLDVSGSMAGEKLQRAQEAARWVARALGPQDRISLVTFSADVRVAREPGPPGAPEVLDALIDALQAGGGTNLSGGWAEGLAQVRRSLLARGTNRVVLITDGEANHGVVEPARLAAMCAAARQDAQAPVSTSTLGVGVEFNEDLLLGMALDGGGAFHYARSAEALGPALQEEFSDLGQLVAQNVVLELRLAPWVRRVEQLTTHPCDREDPSQVITVRVGDIVADGWRKVGWNLIVDASQASAELTAAGRASGELPLVSCNLRWFDLTGDQPALRELSLRAGLPLAGSAPASEDPEGALDLAVLRLVRARRKAGRAADRHDLARALEHLACAREEAERGPFASDPAVRQQLQQLQAFELLLRSQPEDYGMHTESRKSETFQLYSEGTATVKPPRARG